MWWGSVELPGFQGSCPVLERSPAESSSSQNARILWALISCSNAFNASSEYDLPVPLLTTNPACFLFRELQTENNFMLAEIICMNMNCTLFMFSAV